jgi:hypothetical protein
VRGLEGFSSHIAAEHRCEGTGKIEQKQFFLKYQLKLFIYTLRDGVLLEILRCYNKQFRVELHVNFPSNSFVWTYLVNSEIIYFYKTWNMEPLASYMSTSLIGFNTYTEDNHNALKKRIFTTPQ